MENWRCQRGPGLEASVEVQGYTEDGIHRASHGFPILAGRPQGLPLGWALPGSGPLGGAVGADADGQPTPGPCSALLSTALRSSPCSQFLTGLIPYLIPRVSSVLWVPKAKVSLRCPHPRRVRTTQWA